MKSTLIRVLLGVASVATLAVALAACGGGSSDEPGSTQSGSSQASATSSKEKQQQAAAFVAPYIGKPSPFPVTEKLAKTPKGARIAYMDCGAPICALLWQIMQPAAATMGVKLERVKAGSAANTISAAFDSVVAKKPAAVIAMADPLPLWSRQLEQLKRAKVPVVVNGVAAAEAKRYGVPTGLASSAEANELGGKLLANYVIAKMAPKKVVFYDLAGVTLTKEVEDSFLATLKSGCPECSVRTASIPPQTLGSTAPNLVVSDLQSHPGTNVAVFSSGQILLGLPEALRTAGIKVKTLDYGPGPANLQAIKEGKETAGLAADYPVIAWAILDQAARAIAGQELTGPQAQGIGVNQFLTAKDIVFDPSKGWTGYPDFPKRFATLWGTGS
jgi:ribose transport system substrate-binding protein